MQERFDCSATVVENVCQLMGVLIILHIAKICGLIARARDRFSWWTQLLSMFPQSRSDISAMKRGWQEKRGEHFGRISLHQAYSYR